MQAPHGTRAASFVTAVNSRLAPSPSFLTRTTTTVCPAMRKSLLPAARAVKRSVNLSNIYGLTWFPLYKAEENLLCCRNPCEKWPHICFVKALAKGGVTYRDEPWHKECFVCTNCKTQLAGQHFTSRDESPYCLKCFGSLYAKKCEACSKPITGKMKLLYIIQLCTFLKVKNSPLVFNKALSVGVL